MINIVFSEFYKILRSKILIVVSIILLFMFSMSLGFSIYYGKEVQQLTTGFLIYQESFSAKFIYYIILIFVTSLITAEYANGTVRQMACRGISRWKLVFGQYIAIYFTITLILLAFGVLNLLSSTMFNQLGEVDLTAFLNMNIGILCMFFGVVGVGTFLSYLFKSGGVATAISIILVISGDYFAQFLKLLTNNDIFIKYSLSNMQRIVTDLTSSSEDVFKCSIVFLALGIITIIGSSLLFSKRDVD
ncbi:ABC transporter permease [Romboutsia maritimum]|uniref:ABC transporter permease n=1 Tax=Romboutsia maritimum TaxID=2020948 RepID=A0A371IQD9_9FIRM|nr:ABC transporter permease [Romboutsia maritimum]RDY22694.1 ABC transporter permease [Romboutsia maritimum]